MTIVIYKGQFQYGVVDLFIDNTIKCLQDNNNKVITIDLSSQNERDNLLNILSTEPVDCIIGYNGIGSELQMDGKSIYDIVKTRFLGIYVDHPAYHIGRLIDPIQNHLVSFIDKAHVDYVQNILPEKHKLNFFLPHAGLENEVNDILEFNNYKSQKDIDIVFSGTYLGEPIKEWEKIEAFPVDIIDEIIELLVYDEYISVHGAFDKIFEKEKIKLATMAKAQLSVLMSYVITYVRAYKRNLVLEKIFQSGLNISICGKGWENIIEKYKNVTYMGDLNIQESIELTKRSKITINANPNFTEGGHERVFTAMLNHSVVFSDRSRYYDEYYENEKNIFYYTINTLDKDIQSLKNYIKDEKLLFDMATSAHRIMRDNHTFKHRIDKIQKMIILSKSIDL